MHKGKDKLHFFYKNARRQPGSLLGDLWDVLGEPYLAYDTNKVGSVIFCKDRYQKLDQLLYSLILCDLLYCL